MLVNSANAPPTGETIPPFESPTPTSSQWSVDTICLYLLPFLSYSGRFNLAATESSAKRENNFNRKPDLDIYNIYIYGGNLTKLHTSTFIFFF